MSSDPPATARRRTPDPRLPVRARHLLRIRAVWLIPLAVASVVVAVMTALYIGSVVNPLAHLRGLPVAVVNQDRGATAAGQHLDAGRQVQAGLMASPTVSGKLRLEVLTLSQAEQAMGRDGLYATLVIPPGFSASLLNVAGLHVPGAAAGAAPQVVILTNERAGTEGASLATGILQPALAAASHQIGRHLIALTPPGALTDATRVLLASPVTVTTAQYRPLPANTALGLSAFYIALLTIMCGFLGATIVNAVVDSALGYSTNEIGPHWRLRQPVPINRWQTLLMKWAVVAALTAMLTALMLAIAAGALGMDAPYPALLWLYTWLCAASVGAGTIALFAVAGSYGQLIGLLVFVYAGLASAGGTTPVEALPSFLHALSYIEPLRQVLAGTRSILYFGAQGVADLTRGTLAAALGLVFWLAIGTAIVKWYDRKRLYRLHPDLLAHVSKTVQDLNHRRALADGAIGADHGQIGAIAAIRTYPEVRVSGIQAAAIPSRARPDAAAERQDLPHRVMLALFIGIPLAALLAAVPVAWGWGLSWPDACIGVAMYLISSHGITIGYHRLFTHRSFRAAPGLRIALAIAGSMALQGRVTRWVADHRKHHQFSDRPGDPHSPWRYGKSVAGLARGMLYAHVGWIIDSVHADQRRYAPDLLADPGIARVCLLYPAWVAGLVLLPPLAGGLLAMSWQGAVTAFFWATIVRCSPGATRRRAAPCSPAAGSGSARPTRSGCRARAGAGTAPSRRSPRRRTAPRCGRSRSGTCRWRPPPP
jgi:YhgE/Pip-like protein